MHNLNVHSIQYERALNGNNKEQYSELIYNLQLPTADPSE